MHVNVVHFTPDFNWCFFFYFISVGQNMHYFGMVYVDSKCVPVILTWNNIV